MPEREPDAFVIGGATYRIGVLPDEAPADEWIGLLHSLCSAYSEDAWKAAVRRSLDRGNLPYITWSTAPKTPVLQGYEVRRWLAYRFKPEDLELPYTPYQPPQPPRYVAPSVRTGPTLHSVRYR